jgi:subtilisin
MPATDTAPPATQNTSLTHIIIARLIIAGQFKISGILMKEERTMPKMKPNLQRYIVMPREGFDNPNLKAAALMLTGQPVALTARVAATTSPKMRVLDSIREDGPKLVEMSPEGELSLRLSMPELKIVPEVFYYPQWYRPKLQQRHERKAKTKKAGTRVKAMAAKSAVGDGSTITVVDRSTGAPLRGGHVVVFTDYVNALATKATAEPMEWFA